MNQETYLEKTIAETNLNYMKTLFLFILALVPIELLAQASSAKPDYVLIQKAIDDAASDYHYPKLMTRFKQGDTAMTISQKRHLYYGFRYQPAYSPDGVPKEMELLRPILQKKPLSDADALTVISLGKKILDKNPFDLRMMNVLLYASEQIKDLALFNATLGQMKITVDALKSSGDGLSTQTAYFVLSVADEYQLVTILGYKPSGKQKRIDGNYDYLELTENPDKIKGLYFDASPTIEFKLKSPAK